MTGWLDLMFGQVAFQKEFKEKNPQCAECEHVNELIFDRRVYTNLISKKYCPSCPKSSEATKDGDD